MSVNLLKSKLPAEYQGVEYIQLWTGAPEKTGILLNINYSNVSKIELKYEMTDEVQYHGMILSTHAQDSFTSTAPWICVDGEVSPRNSMSISPTIAKSLINTPTDFVVTVTGATGLIKIGGWNDGAWTPVGRYYYVKIYDTSNNLIINLVPCYRKADDEIGMYDTVQDVFYISGGTRTFTKGSDVTNIEVQPIKKHILVGGAKIPSGYQEVEYIESTGTQYIDTGITDYQIMNSNIEVQFEFVGTPSNNDGVFGFHTLGGYGTAFGIQYWTRHQAVAGDLRTESIEIENSLSNVIRMESQSQDGKTTSVTVYQNSISLGTITGDMRFNFTNYNNLHAIVFGIAKSLWNTNMLSSMKLASMKIFNLNNVLIRNFIPCYRKADGEIGLYDTVNGVFYTNQGTGTFSKGSDVSALVQKRVKLVALQQIIPNEYQQVEYLESTGTQYISTGLTASLNISYELEFWNETTSGNMGGILGETNYAWNRLGLFRNGGSLYPMVNKDSYDSLRNLAWFYVKFDYPSFTINNNTHTLTNGSTGNYGIDVFRMGTYYASTKINYVKFYDNGILVRDYVPCYRKSDNVAGMYDKVTDTFYTNAGTGNFVVGSSVSSLPAYKIIKY